MLKNFYKAKTMKMYINYIKALKWAEKSNSF